MLTVDSNGSGSVSGSGSGSGSVVILLTATINTKGCLGVRQSKIDERIDSYYRSFKQWMALDLPYPIYIIENSGYGNPFVNLDWNGNQKVKYISVKLPMSGRRGKGYGEALSQKYFLNNIATDQDTIVVKFTGRWAPVSGDKAFERLLDLVEEARTNPDFCCIIKPILPIHTLDKRDLDRSNMDDVETLKQLTRWFVLKQSNFLEFIENGLAQYRFNDQRGVDGWYESVFYDYICQYQPISLDSAIEVVENQDGSYNQPVSQI